IEQSKEADICLVVGDKMSNNCQSLKKIVEKENNIKTYLIESPIDLEKIDLKNVNVVAVTSGASTPKEIVDRVIQRLKEI
ncbi:MAG: 4-hydroxy-3-methylbut-2-enyl diphosphate reductase, partial [Bacilli bacterium]|nr:4-hydroxy-3-methylbut-2-enyl diphosphate reductase [Bacilli bacterium]